MFRAFRTVLMPALCLIAVALPAAAHNIFTTFTEIEWNDRTGELEVIIQVHGDQLEALLSVEAGERISFLNEADFEKLEKAAASALSKTLFVQIDDQDADLSFLGLEYTEQTAYLYLTAPCATEPGKLTVMNQLFLADLPGQVNSVMVTIGGERKAQDISAGDPPRDFIFN